MKVKMIFLAIIHAVGPDLSTKKNPIPNKAEKESLANCYKKSLQCAIDNQITSIVSFKYKN